ncbi:MAG: hypothetical protein R3C61_18245 [Bacteroidia bacterium]
MDITLTMLAIIQLIGSVVVGAVVLYITYRLVRWMVSRNYPLGEKNTAFSIFVGAIMFSVGYLVSSVIEPLLSTFRTINTRSSDFWSVFFLFSRYLFLFVFISSLIALLVNLVSTSIFMRFTTKTNELKEISENNVSVAIVTAVVIIVITLFARESAELLLESIVPYPGGDVLGK